MRELAVRGWSGFGGGRRGGRRRRRERAGQRAKGEGRRGKAASQRIQVITSSERAESSMAQHLLRRIDGYSSYEPDLFTVPNRIRMISSALPKTQNFLLPQLTFQRSKHFDTNCTLK